MSFFDTKQKLQFQGQIESLLYDQCYLSTHRDDSSGQPIKAFITRDPKGKNIDLGGNLTQQSTQAKVFIDSLKESGIDTNKSLKNLYLTDTDNNIRYKITNYTHVGDTVYLDLEFIKRITNV